MTALGGTRAALAAVLMTLALVATACGDGSAAPPAPAPEFGKPLVKHAFEKTHVVTLAGGVRMAVGSPDGHAIQVQWSRTGDAGDWSAPTTVHTEPLWTHDINLSHRGGIAAIDPDWWKERKLDDDYAPDHTSQVLCEAYRCFEGHRSDVLSGTRFDATGSFAGFSVGERRMLLWDRERGFRTSDVTGLGEHATLRLAPDGSFVAAQGRTEGRLCVYDLYATEVRATSFRRVASSRTLPTRPPCYPASMEVGRDRANVDVEEMRQGVEFRRRDGRWSLVESGEPLVVQPDTDGRSTIASREVDLGDAGRFSVSSPDLRRIMVQTQNAGSRAWSAPRQIGTAPKGTLCRLESDLDDEEGVAVLVFSCYPEDQPWRPDAGEQARPTVALALATTTGQQWRSVEVENPAFGPKNAGAGRILVQGAAASYLFARGYDDFVVLDLPSQPDWDDLQLIDDGERIIRLAGNPDGSKPCRPLLYVAPVGATIWGRPTAVPVRDLPSPTVCDGGLLAGEGTTFDLEISSSDGFDWGSSARLTGDRWTFTPQY